MNRKLLWAFFVIGIALFALPLVISMPGKASLLAAVRPDATSALYFVARGDGSSEFSDNLAQHNRAVDRYQRLRNPQPAK